MELKGFDLSKNMVKSMSKKAFLVFTSIFLFFFFLNALHPLSFGDDYLYAFVWQGNPMHVPLTVDAIRISSWHELFVSQRLEYYTWGGRIVGQSLTQFFLWLGKDIFNICNALISTLLIAEIYWCSNKGKVDLHFNWRRVCWIFFAIWSFTPGFNPVFFWLTGSCIYVWTTFLLLLFLLPYIKKYHAFHKKIGENHLFALGMFLLGVVAGFGNENCICWIILALVLFVFSYRKFRGKEMWMYTGLIGLCVGYAFLIFAPGNTARLHAQYGINWFNLKLLKDNFYIFTIVLTFQLLLWHFNLKSLYITHKTGIGDKTFRKDILMVKIACVLSFSMTAIMLFSPFFPPRSGFPGTIMLVIAATVLIRLQQECGIALISNDVRKFLYSIGILYFIMSASISIQYFYETKLQMTSIINMAKQVKQSSADQILIVKPFKDSGALKDLLSGYHLSYFDLSEDENDWGNVAFARYYGIKGIRMIRGNGEDKKENRQESVKITSESTPTVLQSH